jgi:phospholipase/lecithinase/hemolysin
MDDCIISFQSLEDVSIDLTSIVPAIELPSSVETLFSNSSAITQLLISAYYPSLGSIDLSSLLSSNLASQLIQFVTPIYEAVLTRYPEVFIDLSEIISNLPDLNFSNPLTIDLGNTLSDRSFNQIVIFGDSLSDTGNLSTALGGLFPPPPFFNGRLSNGPLWLDFLAPELGISNVVNFSFAGSTSGRTNIASIIAGQDLGPLPGVLDQIDLFAGQLAANGIPAANPNALYVVWGGANDFLTLPPQPLAAIQSVFASVENVAQSVITLAGLGAKTIVVPNIPNLAITPFVAARNLTPQAAIFSTLFNTLLQGTLGGLESQLGIDIVQVDVFSLSSAIAQRPTEFGFTNATTPLFQALASQPNPDTFVFADDFHPTTTVHRLISDGVKRSLSTPTPGRVLPTSGAIVRELVNSSGFRSLVGSFLNRVSADLFPSNTILATANNLLTTSI